MPPSSNARDVRVDDTYDLIIFSHLRWNFVWQRPQHLLSRMASRRRVFFFEEPTFEEGPARLEITEPTPNVFVCKPVTSSRDHGFSGAQIELLKPLVKDLLTSCSINKHAAWFYTPMAIGLLSELDPLVVIYDCMDELSAFRHAPPELLEREVTLLENADLVFTGGPSLYKSKATRHPNVYCFPSSVDATHFGQARDKVEEPADQAAVPHPRFGFFGVVDERFDAEMFGQVARSRPKWQFVVVGPIVKIDPATLPQLPNVLYTGQRKYEELPNYLAGWDVSVMPFARNEATRFISPTKTLEYMAAEKPIVSTSIIDVVELYPDIVYFGDTAEDFEAACERALNSEQAERSMRTELMRGVLARTSWDITVEKMCSLIEQFAVAAVKGGINSPFETELINGCTSASTPRTAGTTSASMHDPQVVVVGAGPTGLSAAYHLGEDALLLEQNETVGGWCRSIEREGFTFDFAGHIMFSNDPYVHEMYAVLLGENVHWQNREAWIYSKDVYTRYPFQGALYGLPPEVIKECLIGAIESRFGALKAPSDNATGSTASASGCTNGHNGAGKGHSAAAKNRIGDSGKEHQIDDCCGDGVLESTARLQSPQPQDHRPQPTPENFEDFIYRVWGRGIAKHFAIPYNRKLWAVPLKEMETSWLGGRVPLPDLEEMIEGALSPVPKPMGPNARFGYPLRGGFQALMNGFLPLLKGPMRLKTRVTGFSPSRRQLTLDDGSTVSYEQLISTMPLPVLVRLAGDEAPVEVQNAALGLRYISVRCVHLGIGRENLTEKHWIYYPEDTVFHRIFVQGNASPLCNPPGGFGLTCEITYHSESKPLPCDGDELIKRCIDDCRQVGIVHADDEVITSTQVDLPHAYVIYDHARVKNIALIREWLAGYDVVLAGRYSEWEYYNSDHAFLAGKKAADKVRELQTESRTVREDTADISCTTARS